VYRFAQRRSLGSLETKTKIRFSAKGKRKEAWKLGGEEAGNQMALESETESSSLNLYKRLFVVLGKIK
jgi:hypothetical protein